MILLRNYFTNTTADVDVIPVIHEVLRTLREANLPDGTVTIIVPGPGAGLAVIEPLPDVVDALKSVAALFPGEGMETVNRRKEEISVGPRVAAALLGKFITIPFSGGKPVLDPREEIVLVDFERKVQRREFCVQVTGEAPPQPAKGPTPRRR